MNFQHFGGMGGGALAPLDPPAYATALPNLCVSELHEHYLAKVIFLSCNSKQGRGQKD